MRTCDISIEMPLVLVVDDSPIERFMAREALEHDGFIVIEAEDGEAGIALFRERKPELVLLDVGMPGLDGFEVCARLRQLPEGEHTPIVMVTGLDDNDSIHRAYNEGATDFITKPMNTAMLQHRMRYLMRAKTTADELRRSEAKLARAQRLAKLGHWEWRADTGSVQWSEDIEQMLGTTLSTDEGVLGALQPFVNGDDAARLKRALQSVRTTLAPTSIEHNLKAHDGSQRIVNHAIDPNTDAAGEVQRLVGAIQDISAHREAERRIRSLAYFDPVTNLPNRTFLSELLTRVIALARRHNRVASILFLDLDQFKRVNDTFGHGVGDDLLREVAKRLRECVRECDCLVRSTIVESVDGDVEETVARLGGDEFVILLPEVNAPEDAAQVARRICAVIEQPVALEGRELQMTGSIGISCFPNDGADVMTLLKHADAAMYQAKAEGRNRFQFFTKAIDIQVRQRVSLEISLREALELKQFVLHYQPIVELETGRVCAAEALVRWQSGDRLVSPAEFISVAEETGLIVPLGRWVLNEACREAVRWERDGVFSGRISVNLSAGQFKHPDLVHNVETALRTSGLSPDRLQLELTESMLMEDTHQSTYLLDKLKSLGTAIAIDDFGTGYSSLAYLKRFPIDILKIDRSFISDVTTGDDDAAIVSATLMLGRALRLQVVAEGVETQAQHDFLQGQGCDECQGYLFSKPLASEDFAMWLSENRNDGDQTPGLSLAGMA
ncbi:MAG: EAL domain-containing protein [Pseudomonadota bacterium]